MHIVDSHCHIDKLDLEEFENNVSSMLASANKLSVKEFLCVCISLESFDKVLALAKKYKEIYASVGLHPTVQVATEPNAKHLASLAADDNVVAIGETGLDYFHIKKDSAKWQRDRFREHIKASQIVGKPLIIHTRCAKDDTLKIMRETGATSGVMHCFSEDYQSAKAAISLGFYISFSGIVTFKNAKMVQEVAQKIPLF